MFPTVPIRVFAQEFVDELLLVLIIEPKRRDHAHSAERGLVGGFYQQAPFGTECDDVGVVERIFHFRHGSSRVRRFYLEEAILVSV